MMNEKLLEQIQAECYYWDNKARLLTPADIPLEVLIWISKLRTEYTKFQCEALECEVEITIRGIKS